MPDIITPKKDERFATGNSLKDTNRSLKKNLQLPHNYLN